MLRVLNKQLRKLQSIGDSRLLAGGMKGIEKESLRVTPTGNVAQTPHPRALGSALTHPHITTDYSEALLELITAPFPSLDDMLRSLEVLHTFVYSKIGDEILWATSMPCVVGGDASIPIAEYGSSNVGKMKHVYRRGLDYRYGRMMQAIAGIHFNYSLPLAFWPMYREVEQARSGLQEFRSEHYFRLIRNFQRHGWLIPYLFGASPALCRSFLGGREHRFEQFDRGTLYAPYATSLRMSDIGYKNKAQAELKICYNSIDTYIASLTHAITTPAPEYAAIGVCVDGEWRQLNDNILQIENEYYSFIRPKSVARSGERPTLALRRGGVEYVEIRALDVNVFDPMGLNADQLRFVEAFLLVCLLLESPPIGSDEQREVNHNQAQVARNGRDPGLTLQRGGQAIPLRQWACELVDATEAVAELLDQTLGTDAYRRTVAIQRAAVADPDRTPSARILAQMRAQGETFVEFALRHSHEHARRFRSHPLPPDEQQALDALAAQSLREQAELEASDTVSFEEYLENYFSQR